jgi:hypothetical protein
LLSVVPFDKLRAGSSELDPVPASSYLYENEADRKRFAFLARKCYGMNLFGEAKHQIA